MDISPSTDNLFAAVGGDEDGDPGDGPNSDKEEADEHDAEEPSRAAVPEERKESGAEEFIDEEHESQFCLETNFTDEEEETDGSAENRDSTGKNREKGFPITLPVEAS